MRRLAGAYVASLGLVALACAAPAAPQELRILSSNGVRAALDGLVPTCERDVERTAAIDFGTSASIRQRVSAGEAVDIVFLTVEVVDALAKAGHLTASSIAPLGRAGIGVGIREGAERPGIATAATIKQTLQHATSVTAPSAAPVFAAKGITR